MAQSIGSKIQAVLVGFLIAMLVLAFAVWGINDVFSPSGKNAVMSLGKNDITTADFDAEFRRELTVLAQSEGRQLPHQEAFDRGVHQQVLQKLMISKIIEIDADDLGIGVNTRSARDYVADIEPFRDELTGKFSEAKMMELLSLQRPPVTRAQFEKNLIDDMRQRQTIPAINGGVVAPLEFAQQRYQYLTEQRKAKVLTFDAQAVAAPPEPTDEELQAYIDQNPIRFTAPEYRRVTFIRLETEDLVPGLEATEEEIQDLFKLKIDLGEIGSPETRSVVQITAGDEDTAKAAAERLAKGENPADVAALLNLIEPVTYDDVIANAIFDPETAAAGFELEEGAAKAVLGSLGNWYAVSTTKITPAVNPNRDEMHAELEAELLHSKAQELMYDITPKIEDVLDGGGTIEDAAEAADLPYASIDYIDRSGTTRDDLKLSGFEVLKGIATDEKILTEIFINDIGYPTDLFETSTDGWAVLRVDEVIESKVRPFDDVRDRAKSLWITQKTNEALDERMYDLAGRAQAGENLDIILADAPNGASVEDVILVRSAPSQKIGPQVTVGLLDAGIGDIERGAGSVPMTRQIAILTDIVANQDGLAGQYADILQDQATAAILSDLNNAYQQAVLNDNPIREFPEKIIALLGLDTDEQ
ncbi:MAG: SurA N-terminal domain-containing protein [Alphaproteobacteria bacterium]